MLEHNSKDPLVFRSIFSHLRLPLRGSPWLLSIISTQTRAVVSLVWHQHHLQSATKFQVLTQDEHFCRQRIFGYKLELVRHRVLHRVYTLPTSQLRRQRPCTSHRQNRLRIHLILTRSIWDVPTSNTYHKSQFRCRHHNLTAHRPNKILRRHSFLTLEEFVRLCLLISRVYGSESKHFKELASFLTTFRFTAKARPPLSQISQIRFRRKVSIPHLYEDWGRMWHFLAASFCEISPASLSKLGFDARLQKVHKASFPTFFDFLHW